MTMQRYEKDLEFARKGEYYFQKASKNRSKMPINREKVGTKLVYGYTQNTLRLYPKLLAAIPKIKPFVAGL
jgi:hypothetical protein